MVIDSSALMSILLDEQERPLFRDALAEATSPVISAATFVEVSIAAMSRRGDRGRHQLSQIIAQNGIRIIPVDEELARLAVDAWARFGQGRHPARLNYGDCFSYALAVKLGEPLLYKGNDFAQTDVRSAL
ncbi:MAG: type II toxin-antitoxin system VapC family toxin [Actinomycetia bacterium]|nr:type II toxin-antitoxin system VapC family toxin [Actinomycetes bacterium]